MTSGEKIFKEFQEHWGLEKVKNMTLEEYTGVGENRDDFTYWIEHKLHNLGKFGGGDSGARYGIYQCKTKPKRDYGYDGIYAWQKKLGKNKEEVFSKIKQEIIKIIQLSKENKLDAIDNCKNILYSGFKWKIAFHYQNIEDMKIVCIFSNNVLQKIAKGENLGENLSIAQIYEKLLGDKTYTLETMIREKSKLLWQKYGENSQEIKENPMSNNPNTQIQNTIPLNQILYGPPGTGKTYETINKALEILAEFKQIDSIPRTRQEQNAIFKQFKKQGQIAFITFHQSFSYEEFVEGIKPAFVDESGREVENSKDMVYKVKNGIFKKICEEAFKNYENSKKELKQLQNEHYTESLISAFIAKLENGDIALECNGWKFQKTFRNSTYKIWGSDNRWLLLKKEGRQKDLTISIAAILKYYDEYKKKLNIKVPSPYNETHCYNEFYTATFKKLKEFEDTEYKGQDNQNSKPVEKVPLKPYILIIDEINRGNISKILGELITLIEPSKRIGNDEELRVTLPYSQETFGVPSNLYIIGTMNTADRSIALLDTALRRRFEFSEMMPDCEVLKSIWLVKDTEGKRDKENYLQDTNLHIDEYQVKESKILFNILKTLNHRIEFLLDREHTIGHAFFFEKAKYFENKKYSWHELSLNDLKTIFAKKIIPLLQEYFYEDYAKIDAVLNGNGMIESKSMQDLDISLSDGFVESNKRIYKIASLDNAIWDNPQTYIKIHKTNQ